MVFECPRRRLIVHPTPRDFPKTDDDVFSQLRRRRQPLISPHNPEEEEEEEEEAKVRKYDRPRYFDCTKAKKVAQGK
jgi:hypothetical protein